MTLSEGLTFERAIVTSLKVEPGEEEPKLVLSLRSSFSPMQARALCCEDLLHNGEGEPRNGWESIPLECELEGVKADLKPPLVVIAGLEIIPIAIERFKVVRFDSGLIVSFRMVIGGRARDLCDFVTRMGKGSFQLTMEPTQMALFSNEKEIPSTASLEVPGAEMRMNNVPLRKYLPIQERRKGLRRAIMVVVALVARSIARPHVQKLLDLEHNRCPSRRLVWGVPRESSPAAQIIFRPRRIWSR